MERIGKIARVMCFSIVVMSMVLGGLLAPSGVAAYAGEGLTWQIFKRDNTAFILVTAYDTGDVYANTNVVNEVDAAFIRDTFGADYKNVHSTGIVAPVTGTTVIRKFSFTLKGGEGVLLVADEYGPRIWLFMFWPQQVRGAELDSFVSGTILSGTPTNIPLGYGPAVLQD